MRSSSPFSAVVTSVAFASGLPMLAACAHPAASTGPRTCAATAAASRMEDIAAVIDDFHDAAAKADEARYFDHFATGGIFLGTDGKERWTVPEFRAYAHPYFAKGKAWSFRSTRRSITVSGDVAWFDEDLDTPNLGPARGSGVLVRDASRDLGRDSGALWKIAQYNLSVPIPNERFKDVKALIEGGR